MYCGKKVAIFNVKLVVHIVTTRLLRVNNTAGSSGYIVSNSKVINELCMEKNVKRSGNGVLFFVSFTIPPSLWRLTRYFILS